ncbi:hypothetical protein G3A_14555 [Bacillus sp. 17376]|uniref:Uncharacterized protein n=1 Tax=Mesobacillus boroniphilus JCM 21738 TaxID=1294265 RepID=W4RV81_9BACI|nr:hypothetical protein [Mesobacillus boroniphilus]ESU31815.1 hypothetical protein G3A_14555 [Bacillus sp. 17376]GAE47778.1 hypothetical protein JCM21738_4793 [Mesobacillus boroniphilus JCM 21738]
MVIQPNMSTKSIIEVWENTKDVFKKHNITISEVPLEKIVDGNILDSLIMELNNIVGSSSATCVEGG